jgi:hypothetical protein
LKFKRTFEEVAMRGMGEWTVGYRKSAAPKFEYQVAVAIALVLSATFLCNAYVEPTQPAAEPQPINSEVGAQLLKVNFTDEGFRARAASPLEFAAVYGLAADKPYTALAAANWSTPARGKAAAGPAAKPQTKATVAQACSVDCVTPPQPIATVVPPRRPADLTPAPIVMASAHGGEKRVRLLGVSLPGFVPSGERIARTVVSWGGSIASVIPGLE